MSGGNTHPRAGDVLVMVGTRKGSFLLWSDPARRAWRRSHHHGDWSVHALSYDQRSGSIYAAANNNYLSERTVIQRSAVRHGVKRRAARHSTMTAAPGRSGRLHPATRSGPARCGPARAKPGCFTRATQARPGRASQG